MGAKGPGKCIFQAVKGPKIQNFGNQGATFWIYLVYYEPTVLSYSEVGTYEDGSLLSKETIKMLLILSFMIIT